MVDKILLIWIDTGIFVAAIIFTWLSQKNILDTITTAAIVAGIEGHLFHLIIGQNGYASQIIQNAAGLVILDIIYNTRYSIPPKKLYYDPFYRVVLVGLLNEAIAFLFISKSAHGQLIDISSGQFFSHTNEGGYAEMGILIYIALFFIYFSKS